MLFKDLVLHPTSLVSLNTLRAKDLETLLSDDLGPSWSETGALSCNQNMSKKKKKQAPVYKEIKCNSSTFN